MITLDIETLPAESPEVISRIKSTMKAPANYKDPEKIKAYIDSNLEKSVRDTSFSGLWGRVLCIGYAIDDREAEVMYAENAAQERSILLDFNNMIRNDRTGTLEHTFVGHNSASFDIRFLSQRMMINGIEPIYKLDSGKYNQPVEDTMLMFDCFEGKRYSLENLCLAFGVESPKEGIDGSQVYDYWKEGKHEEIMKYCKRDVVATRLLYNRMKHPLGLI